MTDLQLRQQPLLLLRAEHRPMSEQVALPRSFRLIPGLLVPLIIIVSNSIVRHVCNVGKSSRLSVANREGVPPWRVQPGELHSTTWCSSKTEAAMHARSMVAGSCQRFAQLRCRAKRTTANCMPKLACLPLPHINLLQHPCPSHACWSYQPMRAHRGESFAAAGIGGATHSCMTLRRFNRHRGGWESG